MSVHRFFLTAAFDASEPLARVSLSSEDLHHAVAVLRLRVGEEVELVDPDGAVCLARIESVMDSALIATFVKRVDAESGPRVVLVQCVAKGDKMDTIVRQAVEVGVSAIVPVMGERTIVRLDGRKRAERGERWRRVAKAAAEQSHRAIVPEVTDPAPFEETMELLASYDRVVVMCEGESDISLASALCGLGDSSSCAVVVGPEGGLSDAEVRLLLEHDAAPASLGTTILRTETAAVVAVALVLHQLGGLGGNRADVC